MDELSERELLLLLNQKFDQQTKENGVRDKRLDSHASDIKSLREWRNYMAGGIAVIGAYLGIGKSH